MLHSFLMMPTSTMLRYYNWNIIIVVALVLLFLISIVIFFSTNDSVDDDVMVSVKKKKWPLLRNGSNDSSTFIQTVTENNNNNNNNKSHKRKEKKCAYHRNGYIIANMNGRLGNNLFQIALANRLSCDLCWPIIFREGGWTSSSSSSSSSGGDDYYFPNNQRTKQCFPNAMSIYGRNSNNITKQQEQQELEWYRRMNINQTSHHFWSSPIKFFHTIRYSTVNDLYEEWWKATTITTFTTPSSNDDNGSSIQDGLSLRLGNIYEYDYNVDSWDALLVNNLQNPQNKTYFIKQSQQQQYLLYYNQVRTLHLDGFFIHYNWMASYIQDIQYWNQINIRECCDLDHHIPDEKTVVLHVRNFDTKEDGQQFVRYKSNVYKTFLDDMYFNNNNNYNNKYNKLWIVCQAQDVHIELIQILQQRYNYNDTGITTVIQTGSDEYDALCILSMAQELIVATSSTFSQMAALLSKSRSPTSRTNMKKKKNVHYLLPTLYHPSVTLVVPEWNYHLVSPEKDTIQQYNIDPATIIPMMS